MTVLQRVVALITGLVLLILAGGAVAFALGWSGQPVFTWLQDLTTNSFNAGILALLLFLWGVHFLLSLFRVRKPPAQALLTETEWGQVRVTLKAVESLVYKTARNVEGVKDVDAEISADEEGIAISLSLTVTPDLSVPEVSSQVQEAIARYLQETMGVEARSVTVEVKGIEGTSKPRVE